jgi:hypothetical protein
MQWFIWILAAAVLAFAGFYGAVLIASESGEVVTLRTYDGTGSAHDTRLWLVDIDGAQWVRTGHPGKGWFRRALDQPAVELTRGSLTTRRVAVPMGDPPVVRAVNGAFTAKYGAADWIVALSGDAAERVPVRLDPVAVAP